MMDEQTEKQIEIINNKIWELQKEKQNIINQYNKFQTEMSEEERSYLFYETLKSAERDWE